MKTNIAGKWLLAGVLMLGTGCSKFLEENNPSSLTSESFYTIPEHAEAAIAAVYAETRFIGNAAAIFSGNWQMLEAVTGTSTAEATENTNLNNLYALSYDGNNLHVAQWWNGLYRVIAQANQVIDKVPGINPMNDAQKQRILGEARFLRAWAYFYAVRLWGDVPLITKPQTASSEDFMPVRTGQEKVYDLVVEDLLAAEAAGLPWMDASGRVSLAAVKAQLARVYLTMAGQPLNKGAAYYKLAADKSKEIIDYADANPAQIDLFPNYGALHSVAEENKLELLFSIQYLADVEANPMLHMLPNNKPVTVFGGWTGTTVPTRSFYATYETGDLRAKDREGFFYTSYYMNGSGALFQLGAPYIFKFFNTIAFGTAGKTGTGQDDLNLMQIRYAEVLLMYAEAQNESGGINPAAYNALKKIRDRAELTTAGMGTFTQQSFREAVWRERWHELCYEGITWFDMVRLRKVYNETNKGFDDFVGHVNLNSNQPLQARHLLFPLPRLEMQNNPNLKPQNPGYPQ
ncbi:RagB/SusD family nutrient uptake outer membrane protein [Chitinophaga caseinilytica]|uniref:RagB/SusD family nutrient uptake outer membrane protein n=1 Tax=Chitinophaga caseinilytica TaxID=2267521 RepID=UPI003C2B716C